MFKIISCPPTFSHLVSSLPQQRIRTYISLCDNPETSFALYQQMSPQIYMQSPPLLQRRYLSILLLSTLNEVSCTSFHFESNWKLKQIKLQESDIFIIYYVMLTGKTRRNHREWYLKRFVLFFGHMILIFQQSYEANNAIYLWSGPIALIYYILQLCAVFPTCHSQSDCFKVEALK